MSDKGITLEGLAAAVDALRQELATWKALAHKQDQLSADQITATQSGATAAKISQIAVNTAAIQSLAAQVAGQISLAYVTTLPATGEPLTLYLVPQGDGTAPNFCNEYLWINDAWELIGTTGAMANNGELTIQVNGVAVGTFTANQAANSAINIAVPTNTNQLVNGAGYVDAAALQAALALKQNSLNASQLEAVNSGITAAGVQQIADNAATIAGKQDALTAAQQAAVDSGATAAKIDQIASNASAIVSLTSSKQDSLSTTQLAAVNSGVTASAVQQIGTNATNISGLQTAVASKAADNAVVHLAGAETITGDKTFTGATATHDITPEANGLYQLGSSSLRWTRFYGADSIFLHYQGLTFGTPPTQATYFGLRLNDNTGAIYGDVLAKSDPDGHNALRLRCRNTDGTNTYDRQISLIVNSSGVTQFVPNATGIFDLGRASAKWATLNGINPGALSLPNFSTGSAITIDTTDWILNGTSFNLVKLNSMDTVMTQNGWLYVRANSTAAGDRIGIRLNGVSADRPTVILGEVGFGHIEGFVPVVAGYAVNIFLNKALTYCKFYPCQGNV